MLNFGKVKENSQFTIFDLSTVRKSLPTRPPSFSLTSALATASIRSCMKEAHKGELHRRRTPLLCLSGALGMRALLRRACYYKIVLCHSRGRTCNVPLSLSGESKREEGEETIASTSPLAALSHQFLAEYLVQALKTLP